MPRGQWKRRLRNGHRQIADLQLWPLNDVTIALYPFDDVTIVLCPLNDVTFVLCSFSDVTIVVNIESYLIGLWRRTFGIINNFNLELLLLLSRWRRWSRFWREVNFDLDLRLGCNGSCDGGQFFHHERWSEWLGPFEGPTCQRTMFLTPNGPDYRTVKESLK